MNTIIAQRLASRIGEQRAYLGQRVSLRLLDAFPELHATLQAESVTTPELRLSAVAVEPLSALVRGMLVFETLSLAEQELVWAAGVLPNRGVSHHHQATLVRWFFEEVHALGLTDEERSLAQEMEGHMLAVMDQVYQAAPAHA